MSERIGLDGRKSLSVTEVKEVVSFGDREIKLTLGDGMGLIVKGEKLKIIDFSKESGELKAQGDVSEISFRQKKDVIKRLFK
jgi:hypothetical protein